MTRLGWGIAGCGWVARDYVAPAIVDSANGALLAVYDPSEGSRAQARAAFGVPCHGSMAAFLATPGMGAVYVASPNDSHRGLVEAAAGAGLAVLCEKPMAVTLADAEAMVGACAAAGVPYATAFDQRFHAAHVELARMVAAGAVGRPVAVRIVYACWVGDGWAADNWRVDRARAGGGALFDLAPHGLDLAAMILGERIGAVAALGQARVHAYAVERGEVEDGALLMARSEGGVLLQMHVAYNCPETLPRRRLEVVGDAGQLVAVDTMGQVPGGALWHTRAEDGVAREVVVPGAERSPFLNQVEAFAGSVLAGEAFAFTPEHDLHTMALLAKAQAMVLP